MKWTGLNQLREQYLKFFESKEHLIAKSAPLLPGPDEHGLLLINSGMAPLKKYFLGLETPPSKRLTSCQKCIRTPDIEEVGKTSRHGTFFEMLGNFSFGDYFKEEATTWAWEFLTEVLEIPKGLLWVTIYQDDDDAFDIWTKNRGLPPDRVIRLGKKDNFWEIGSGPCGPSSEIFFDRGEKYGCDSDICGIGHCECDRYMEIWNLVFTQFDSDGEGTYTPLAKPNIDTGMGLERLACVMQNVGNLFEVDTMQSIMTAIADIAGVAYGKNEKTDISLRVVTDHIRSTVFLVGDGILPQNEGRGYVLRRLLRRASRHGRLLGISKPFLCDVCDIVIAENKTSYPELGENAEYIKKVISVEEERFSQTIEQGMDTLNTILDHLESRDIPASRDRILDGAEAFRLYDTFGFPIDLTREIAEDRGIGIDETGFMSLMQEQRKRARKAHDEQGGVGWEEDVLAGMELNDNFIGYSTYQSSTPIIAIVSNSEVVDSVSANSDAMLLLAETPFYAESGGQIGDSGVIAVGGNEFTVTDCKKSPTGHILHIGQMTKGTISVGDTASATVDNERRKAISRNHTATHLLQSALKEILGDHVHQSGSYVSDKLLRFDFTHFSAVTHDELKAVELLVNQHILAAVDVSISEMSMDEARKKGATALFGDKYGDVVRVVEMDKTSTELCGGIHVTNTAQIGLFKIISESSVAAGVRRIEAVTGFGVLSFADSQIAILKEIGKSIKAASISQIVDRAHIVMENSAVLQREIAQLKAEAAKQQTSSLDKNMIDLGTVKLVTFKFEGTLDALQEQADVLKEKNPLIVGVMIASYEDKSTLLVFAGKDAVKAGIHAGKLVKEISSIAGGSGGGRPDNAKGGIPDTSKTDEALKASEGFVKDQIGG